uniref:Trafficking protein particle complex subunit 9 n=1 Tax=Syphacia muris TaxID=451379 RepID=A0A0N5AAZ6_9BILA
MESVPLPLADDHCRITVVVKQLGQPSIPSFNRLLELSGSPERIIIPNIISSINTNTVEFGEIQAHRRVIGFIGIVQAPAVGERSPTLESNVADEEEEEKHLLQPSTSAGAGSGTFVSSLSQIRQQYEAIKREYYATLVDSRCIAFGFDEEKFGELWGSRELLQFKSLEESEKLEDAMQEFFRSIFFVLESKHIDLSFEKLEVPFCPSLPGEPKYCFGNEARANKLYKKKCLGRFRKQVADYALLTGLPLSAMDMYQSSIENLKQAGDFLWLAAAYEGWACAAMAVKYDFFGDYLSTPALQRFSTLTPNQLRFAHLKRQRALGSGVEQTYLPSSASMSLLPSVSSTPAFPAASFVPEEQQKRTFKLPWSSEKSRNDNSLDYSTIFEKFKLAVENYEHFPNFAYIEYECVMRAASLLCMQRKYIDMEQFLRDHIAKYLDDNFTLFDGYVKSMICLHAALVFRSVGFKRKDAFFSRLSGLFRLHVEGSSRTYIDYRVVYPLFLRTLPAYGILDNRKDLSDTLLKSGPIQLQRKVLNEVYMSAFRAEHCDAAIRHLCYLLQVYFAYMDNDCALHLLDDLSRLVATNKNIHQLNQHLTIPHCEIIVPPVQLTRFPYFQKFSVRPLPPHLSPIVVKPKPKDAVFIYSPFQRSDTANEDINWVVDCVCEVSVSVSNCLPIDLSVHRLSLLTEGCAFEAVPVELTLAPSENSEPVDIKLLGVPKEPGTLTITGYSCEVFGVRNVCRLRDLSKCSSFGNTTHLPVFSVKVLPPLPILELHTSLPRAPISDSNLEPTAETTVYSGQTFEHEIEIYNSSENIDIHDVQLEIVQPKVNGGPSLIEVIDVEDSAISKECTTSWKVARCLKATVAYIVYFFSRIFGIDPAAAAEAASSGEALQTVHTSKNCEEISDGGHDRIPFTGRLLISAFVFRYRADVTRPSCEEYERCSRLPLAVTVMPAVTVAAWHVLPGEGPLTRYVVVDVTNSTEWDAELKYGGEKMIGVQPKELCRFLLVVMWRTRMFSLFRVPLLCECCSKVSPNAFRLAESKASYLMQMQEMERLRQILEKHVSALLDIRWFISAVSLEGTVPVGPILSSISLLKQLVVPAISVEMRINGVLSVNEEDIVVGIGEVVDLEVQLISSANENRHIKGTLRLGCYQDLMNGANIIENNSFMRVLNAEVLPFVLSKQTTEINNTNKDSVANGHSSVTFVEDSAEIGTGIYTAEFLVLFLCEGNYKVKPLLQLDDQNSDFIDEELFCSTVTFNVITKVS